ncbi:helix-turn-helix transcriptional regulator [Microvirga sp. STS02]|uniref:helix-turn-helix transcriptional regulator n=1 Tax=Hymenobacter negativus TaxID=2795026 RepID=UPI0018DEBBE3|nr:MULTISPECIES: helix-turn-helix transcriptional regulator [Bacteria]MBH8567561.1 helix-turn-helix transcriptional regulator [Hymenobacter negativus]MBR7207293.1 helix-turn-helix transcriptional regulator [Microvirga sp. STS02]
MTPFAELAASREYWLTKTQNELYDNVEQFLERKGWTRTQLADHLGVTKGYVSQILNGDFDHKLSKLIDLSLAVGVVPNIKFQEINDYVTDYLSGYDMCLNADDVSVTIEVTNTLNSYTFELLDGKALLANQLVDNETFTSFDYASKAA